ncbi:MAG: FAD:protein FMN transferase [Oscillospiraceae bacterium]|nr:FAD:protein FMN transferase [Oscillospiraceae bacterium]
MEILKEKIKKTNGEYILLLFTLIGTIIGIVLIFSAFLDREEKIYDSTTEIMGLKINQTVYGEGAQKASRAAEKQINTLLSQISWNNDGSQIQKVNKDSHKSWVDVSPGVLSILLKALDVANDTKGAFDPTVLPISMLWSSYFENKKSPSNEEILKKKLSVGYEDLKINKDVSRVRLFKSDSGIDLTSISTGAACSAALKQYQKNGAYAGLICVGKSVGVFGNRKNSGNFKITIPHPFYKDNENNNDGFGFLEIAEGCVCTVDFQQQDVILDPRTGYPIQSNFTSVTVFHPDGIIANALAVSCSMLGKEEGFKLLEKYRADGIFVDNARHVFVSDNFWDKLIITDNNFSIIDW